MSVGSKVLGLAVGQKSILAAEVQQKGDKHLVGKYGEFVFPEGLSLGQPEKLGQAFRDFLRNKGFSTKDTVIGLPAKRLVTRRKELPAASASVAASTLRLQAEGEFSSELDNLVMDFAGTTSSSEPSTVLLIATKKVVVDECTLMAEAAGLRVHAVTSTSVALGRATSRLPGGDGFVLDLGSSGAELIVQHGKDPAQIRHLNVSSTGDSLGLLAGEIRRTMASIPRNGTPQTLAVWNTGTSENPESILEQRLAIPVTAPGLDTLVSSDGGDARLFVPAIAVALMAMESAGPVVDFLHSRLAPPKAPAMSPKKKLTYAIAISVTAIVAFGYYDLDTREKTLADLKQKNDNSKTVATVTTARADLRRYEDAMNWMPKSPHFVAVLSDLTNVFVNVLPNPSTNNSVWLVDLSNKDNSVNTWDFKGQATSKELVDRVRDYMLQNSKLTNADRRFANVGVGAVVQVQQKVENGMGRGGIQTETIWAFNINFEYVPKGTPVVATRGGASRPTTKAASAPASAAASAPSPETATAPGK